MKFLLSTATIAAMALIPATASAQFSGFNSNTVFGGAAGAGVGGVIGSQIAGSGNRTEGAVIGAVLGGLGGSALANGRSNSRYGSGPVNRSGFGGGFGAPAGFNGGFAPGGFVSGGFVPAGAPVGFGAPAGFNGGFAAPGGFAPVGVNGGFGAPVGFGGRAALPPAPLPSSRFVNGGFVSGPIVPVRTSRPSIQRTVVRQRTIQAPPRIVQQAPSCLLYTSPSPRDRQKSRMPSSA